MYNAMTIEPPRAAHVLPVTILKTVRMRVQDCTVRRQLPDSTDGEQAEISLELLSMPRCIHLDCAFFNVEFRGVMSRGYASLVV